MSGNLKLRIQPVEDGERADAVVDVVVDATGRPRTDAERAVAEGGVIAREATPEAASRLVARLEEHDVVVEVTRRDDGEQVPVDGFYRVRGAVTGGSVPDGATVGAFGVDDGQRPLGSSQVFDDGSYDVTYPVTGDGPAALLVRAVDGAGETLAESPQVESPEALEIVDLELPPEEPESISGGDDVFAFTVHAPPVAVPDEELVSTSEELLDGELAAELASKKADEDRLGMADVAEQYASSEAYAPDLDALELPLADLDAALTGNESPETLRRAVETTLGATPPELVDSDRYQQAKRRVASSLTAATISLNGRDDEVAALKRGMKLFSLVERAADDDESLDRYRAVGRALDREVSLPGTLYPLPKNRPRGEDTEQTTVDSGEVESLASALSEVRSARQELVDASVGGGRSFATLMDAPGVVDGDHGGDPDDPDLSGDGGTVAPTDAMLESGILEPLSESTAAMVADLDGPSATGEDVGMLGELRRKERALGEKLQYTLLDGGGETVIDQGSNRVPATALVEVDGAFPGPYIDDEDVIEDLYPSKPHVNPVGFSDLMVMRKTLDRYEMGDVAHVENVLEGERRERTHRTLERNEEYVGTETERVKEKEKSMESTERFEMTTETSKTIEREQEIDAGVKVSASYGPSVKMKTHMNYNLETSKKEKKRTAQRYAREVTKKTVNRIKERVKRKEWEKTIEETEETNLHEIDNRGATDHVIGIYRWLDKYVETQVFNYGRRMLLEFIVPEPAAFYRYSLASSSSDGVDMDKPTPPKASEALLEAIEGDEPLDPDDLGGEDAKEERDLRPTDLRAWNYSYYVQKYGAEASPPPREYKVKTKTMNAESQDNTVFQKSGTIEVPEGYAATQVFADDPLYSEPDTDDDHGLSAVAGGWKWVEGRLGGENHGEFSREPSRTLVVEGSGSATKTEYEAEVTGVIEQKSGTVDGRDVSEDDIDTVVGGSRAEGRVGGGRDGFRFTGSIKSLSVDEPSEATIYVDGTQYQPSDFPFDRTDLNDDIEVPAEGNVGILKSKQKPWTGRVPLSVYAEDSKGYSIQFWLLCERTEEAFERWQLETYQSIVEAYRNERSEYEEAVAAKQIQGGPEITGQNPGRNREIEQTELKRNMLAMLRENKLYPDDIDDGEGISGVPDIDLESIEEDADTVRFLEQAFEWTNMTYRFYPYFWADESKWTELSRVEANDPTFASFLRAGAARVVVPVRPGYERHVPYFMNNKKPYSGDERPEVGDADYLPIIEAVEEQQDKLPDDARAETPPEEVKLPTSLVKLQQGGSLSMDGS